MARHPMQPVEWDGKGVIRFKANPIVRDLLDAATAAGIRDMNAIAHDAIFRDKYTKEDRQQFAQLIGYSLDGYADLQSYVTDGAYSKAAEAAKKLRRRQPKDPALKTRSDA